MMISCKPSEQTKAGLVLDTRGWCVVGLWRDLLCRLLHDGDTVIRRTRKAPLEFKLEHRYHIQR